MPNDNNEKEQGNNGTVLTHKGFPTSQELDKDFDLDDPNSYANRFKSEHGKNIANQFFTTKESLDINPKLPMTYKEKTRIVNRCKLEFNRINGQLNQTGKAKAYIWGWVVAARETKLIEYSVETVLALTEAERNDYYMFLNKKQRENLLCAFRDLVIKKIPYWDEEAAKEVKEYFEAMTMMIN